jgi:Fe-S-cluster-containing hydrogenase component 2
MVSGMAYIIQERCNQCRRCLEVCPQEAIIEVAPVSADDLKISVAGLKNETEEIIARIEKLSKKQNEYKLEKS